MSRARWIAFGSTLTLMSCNDNQSKSLSTMDAAGTDSAPTDVLFDALAETSPDDATDTKGVDDAGADAAVVDDAAEDLLDATRTDVVDDGSSADAPRDASDDSESPHPDVSLDGGGPDVADGGPDVADGAPDGAYFPCCPVGVTSCSWCNRKTELCNLTAPTFGFSPGCFTIDAGAYGNFPEQCMPEPSCWCIDPFFVTCAPSSYRCANDAGGVSIVCGSNSCYGSPPVRWERWQLAFGREARVRSELRRMRRCRAGHRENAGRRGRRSFP
jgi:hypothetical protein